MTILGPEHPAADRAMRQALAAERPAFRHMSATLDLDGLRVWHETAPTRAADDFD